MDLDDFKEQWALHNDKLNQQLKLNETLLRKINLNQSKKTLSRLLQYDLLSLVMNGCLAFYLSLSIIKHFDSWIYSGSSAIALVIVVGFFVLYAIRVQRFMKIDHYRSSIIDVQKQVQELQIFSLKWRKIELIFIPIFIILMMPILYLDVHGVNITLHPIDLIVRMIIILILIFPMVLWSYKYFYDQPLKNSEHFLQEIIDFEQEK